MRPDCQCIKCGSSTVIPAMAADRGEYDFEHEFQARVDANPDAMFRRQAAHSPLKAYVCVQCGFVEFYAENPEALHKAFQAAQDRASKPDR